MTTPHPGGRARRIEPTDIVRIGRDLGMDRLSLNAVAARLGVTATALYRHVAGRWELERLVGESLLSDLDLPDDPADDTAAHLLGFGIRLRAFVLDRPGLAGYLQTLFPRGEAGRRLLAVEVEALTRRGYSPEAAIVLSGAVASLAIGFAAAEDTQRRRGPEIETQRQDVVANLATDTALGDAHRRLPAIAPARYVRLVLTAAIDGLLAAAPPGRPVPDIITALDPSGEDD